MLGRGEQDDAARVADGERGLDVALKKIRSTPRRLGRWSSISSVSDVVDRQEALGERQVGRGRGTQPKSIARRRLPFRSTSP